MKTTLEIPDTVFRRAKSAAAARGVPFREFVTEAVKGKLASGATTGERPMAGELMGSLKHLHKETVRINRVIEEDSERAGVAYDALVRNPDWKKSSGFVYESFS